MKTPSPGKVRPPLIVILGSTAVGKTEISIQLGLRLKAEIVSADSRLFYRGMDIGTAKPTPVERNTIPHHLIDVADPEESWSLVRFQEASQQAIQSIHRRGRLPLLVGGTGQYLRAVIEGWTAPSGVPDQALRSVLNAWAERIGGYGLHRRLKVVDPEAARQIDPRNLRRTVRALEVIFTTGVLFSAQRQRGQSPYRTLQLGLSRPRSELYARIDERIDAMLAAGLVEEVMGLLARGYRPGLPAFSAIGYREIIAYLQGEISQNEAVRRMRKRTREFVRRQANWFKPDDPNIQWFSVKGDIVDHLENAIVSFLFSSHQEKKE